MKAPHGHRWRRGKLVKIPDEWVGRTLRPQAKRKRQSKHPRKRRRYDERSWLCSAPGRRSWKMRRMLRSRLVENQTAIEEQLLDVEEN